MLTADTIFAGYRVERLLGRGGMGDVYLARHPRLPRSDALKLMSEELSTNDVYRQRFSAEADIACQVTHESVVRVYDRGEHDGRLWLAMEYIDGRDLADILRTTGRLPPERAVSLLERIAAGLDAIHANGLLHRDVKPANILVAQDVLGVERALLTDFGIARTVADSLGMTGVGDVVATLHYAAPEQFEMLSGDLDRRVDVYALACVFYEMLTGRVPLMGDSVATFWHVLQSETAVPPSREVSGLPTEMDAVVAKGLAKERDDRYASAGDLARAARLALPPAEATTLVPAPDVLIPGPYRIGVRRDDPAAPEGYWKFGPVFSERLSEADAERLGRLINESTVFGLPASLTGGEGRNAALTVEAPGRFHTVAWAGPPPAAIAELAAEVERLAPEDTAPAAPDPVPDSSVGEKASSGAEAAPGRRRRGGLLVVLAALILVAGAVVVTVLVLRAKTAPGAPVSVSVSTGRGTVTVAWQAGSGKPDHFVVYRDGQVVGDAVKGHSFVDSPADTKRHQYSVQAVDSSARTSSLSALVFGAADVRPLNGAEDALLKSLPTGLVDGTSCKPIPSGVDSHLDTAITCGPGAGQVPKPPGIVPQVIEAYRAPDGGALAAALKAQVIAHNAKNGSCSAIPEAGTWNYGESPTVINGQIICYAVGSRNYLLWSYTAPHFYIRISTTNSYLSLAKYWQGASLHLP